MPGKVKVKIISGRNLPVMDRSSDTTDAYVEIKLGSTTYKTDVCRKSLHPQWNSDWYRFEVDDSELQDEPLQIRLMDHDTYSANDAIGKVYLDLNPLLLPAASSLLKWNEGSAHESPTNSVMSGWIPVYDTMHGIRGEVNIVVKVELFTDFNKFRQSSCGVQFFCSPAIPHGYFAQVVHGFVEELVVNDDPEYQWIDKIRTPRASNEARQTLFFKLSGELQRKIGVKALDLGGNAVIGYCQSFDLEGESGIVARGIGTAVTLIKMIDVPAQGNNNETSTIEERAQSYLKFLGSAKGFFLNSDQTFYVRKPKPVPVPSPTPSMRSLKLDEMILKSDPYSHMTRHLSDREFNAILRPHPIETIHHSTSLQTLLKQEDMRGTPGYGISQKFKNFKYSSQNMISKKMFALKAKLTPEDANADMNDAKKKHTYKYRRTKSDSSGMAEILVRSVFHAASSLDCIAETPHLVKPPISVSDADDEEKTLDSSYLSLPDTSTKSSNDSSTSSTSSIDEDISDAKDMELDTVSHIVEAVRKLSMIQPPVIDVLQIDVTKNTLIEINDDRLLLVVDDEESLATKSNEELNTSETLEPDSLSNVDTLSLGTYSEPALHGSNGFISPELPHLNDIVVTYSTPSTPILEVKKSVFNFQPSQLVSNSLEDINALELKASKRKFSQCNQTVLGHLFKRLQDLPKTNSLPDVQKEHSKSSTSFDSTIKPNSIEAISNLKTIEAAASPEIISEANFDLFLSQISKHFHNNIKKTPSSVSLSDKDKVQFALGGHFTSLHNINDESSKANKYSAHQGKETVLGNLFKSPTQNKAETSPTSPVSEANYDIFLSQVSKSFGNFKRSPTSGSLSETERSNFTLGSQFTSLHNIHDEYSKVNKHSTHKGKGDLKMNLYKSEENPDSNSITSNGKHRLLDKIIQSPKILLHKFEFHKKDEESLLKTALCNVARETVQDMLATSSGINKREDNISEPSTSSQNVKNLKLYIPNTSEATTPLGPISPDSTKNAMFLKGSSALFHSSLPGSVNSSASHESPSTKSLDGSIKRRIMDGPKAVYKRLDSKFHKSGVKDDGLLKTALGNVLMDSLNEVTATSHIASPPIQPQSIEEEYRDEPKFHKSTLKDDGLLKTALGNVLMDSLNEVTATSHIPSPPVQPQNFELEYRDEAKFHKSAVKDDGLLKTALGNVLLDSFNEVTVTSHIPSPPVQTQNIEPDYREEAKIEKTPSKDKNFRTKIKDSKFFKVPQKFFQRLDSKLHKKSRSDNKMKKDDGLLGTALGNVLMDSAKEILATSSSSDPNKTETPDKIISKNSNLLPNNVPDLTKTTINTEIDKGNSDSNNTMHACLTPSPRNSDTPPNESRPELGHQRTESVGTRISHSPAKLNSIPCIHRRSSDSDLSITPKGNSLTGSDRSGGCSSGQFMRNTMIRSTVPQENFDLMEYPFLTMSKYPPGFVAFIGGSVSARSVKLLERITNIEEPESRDTWWSEIRMEIRSHARALNCNAVLGYTETTSICDDVCVLSASGTSAIIGYQYAGELNDNISGLPIIPKANNKEMMTASLDRTDFEKEKKTESTANIKHQTSTSPEREPFPKQACNICHLPYVGNSVPLRNSTSACSVCRTGKVPDVLIATIEMPEGIPSIGRGCFVQSYVCRPLRDLKGESNAKEISDGLPFLEYELHRLLINKLKVKGMNSVFGLKVRISVGERMLIGIATGTAVFLSPLPPPPLPKLVSDRTTDEKKLAQLQKSLHDTVKKNKEIYQLKLVDDPQNGKILSDTDDSEDEQNSLDLSAGNKDCCILEVDDPEDVDVLNALMEPRPPDGFHVVNTELVPGLDDLEIVKNLQMFTQIWRAKIQPPFSLDKHFHRLLQSVYFKLRRMIPCALCDLQFRVDSPEPDEIQLCVLGMALGLGDLQKNSKSKRKNILPKRNDDDMIFNLEEDLIPEHGVVQTPPNTNYLHTQGVKHRQKSPIRTRLAPRQRHVPYRERHGVDITPLSYVPGGKIEKYLGNLNFFFIRETTSIREEGGLCGFIHSFITEILAIVRAHVTALGGNAMVAYFITECVLNHNLHKNQGQCLINVGGDVVYVTYYSEDH